MPGHGGSIVLIEDDASLRRIIQHSLESAGYDLHVADNKNDGVKLVARTRPRLVITDLCLGDSSGLDILEDIKAQRGKALIIVITGHSSLEQAIEAIQIGAYDYLPKPFSREHLLLAVSKALAFNNLQRENRRLKRLSANKGVRAILGDSPIMQSVHDLIRRMAGANASVLILGESGTGKELVARLLHAQSERCHGPFIAVNCAAIPANLLESELFGHMRGSFTGASRDYKGKFQQADGGTLFLDEIGDLPLELQPKLLRVLQEQVITPIGGTEVDISVRVIAATNSDLDKRVKLGQFRNDLYYRLAVLPLKLPALRERDDDITLLAQHFLNEYSGGRHLQLSQDVVEILQNYHWPGNVRELENLMERLAILARSELIRKEDLPLHIQCCTEPDEAMVVQMPPGGCPMKTIEKQAIKQALIACRGNRSKAAEYLRMPRHKLVYRINKYHLDEGLSLVG